MPSTLVRLLLFLSSYFPLSIVFFLLTFEHHCRIAASILTSGILGVVGMSAYLRLVQRLAPFNVRVEQIQRRDGDAMSYIVTYLIPFIAVPFSAWQESVALLIFFLVLALLYVHSNMIHINPMLNLIGYHLYEITLDDGSVRTLLTRRRIHRADTMSVVTIDDDILLEKTR
jgi:hypothetical protein